MRFWLQGLNTHPEHLVPLCQLAEEVGFEGMLEGDHWFMPARSKDHDPDERAPMPWDYHFNDITAAAATALAHTKRLKFGSSIIVLANRTNPFLVAKEAATIARLTDNRYIMGVGVGWMKQEFDLAGVEWSTRGARTEEMIEILRKLWGPQPVAHQGRFFSFPETYALPRPERPIPIYLGSVAPVALRRTGRIADGWIGMTSYANDIPRQMALINEGRREAGRENEPFEFMIGLLNGADGKQASLDDYLRARDMGITALQYGPVEHRLGKLYCTFDDKKRAIEQFAEEVIRRMT